METIVWIVIGIIYFIFQAIGSKQQKKARQQQALQQTKGDGQPKGFIEQMLQEIQDAVEEQQQVQEMPPPPSTRSLPSAPAKPAYAADDFHSTSAFMGDEFRSAGSIRADDFILSESRDQDEFHKANTSFTEQAFEETAAYQGEYAGVDLETKTTGTLPREKDTRFENQQLTTIRKSLRDTEELKRAFLVNEILSNPAYKKLKPFRS